MRIDKLNLPVFRNLKSFEIDFDEGSARTVLVGRNGVGKSNILEALTRIFRQLDLRIKPEFPYQIVYTCNGHRLEITVSSADHPHGDGRSPALSTKINIEPLDGTGETRTISEAAFHRLNSVPATRVLPRHVFGYYSGISGRLRELFSEHTQRYRDDLINGREDTIRPLFLAEDWHSQFVLLAFYAKKDPEIAQFLLDQMGIERLQSVLFILNEPYWYNRDAPPAVRARGDGRYWWAAGTVKRLLSELHRVSLAPMSTKERVPVGIRRFKTKEHRYCYLKSTEALIELAADIDQKEFFKRLESTVMSDLLREVRISFGVRGSADVLTFGDLSEGEQQLLTVLGLLRFTNQDESLFLLDEPDTHLNPAWCLDYLDILTKHGGGLSKSQIIMTTHNPLVFAGLRREEVVILQRREPGRRVEAEHPASDPKGMGFSAILTSDFFGLRSALDRATTDLLDEKRHLGNLDKRTPEEEERLAQLNREIRGLDFSRSVRDPLYSDFVRAMSEKEEEEPAIAAPVLTADALELRRLRALEALKKAQENAER